MALKAKLTEDEFKAAPDPVKEFYKKAGDGYLLDAEGVEDVRGLKSALEKERDSRKVYEAKIKELSDKYADLDPEQARTALAELQKLQDKKLLDEGKVEELVNQRLAARDKDHQRVVSALETKVKDLETGVSQRDRRLEEVLIDTGLRTAATKVGVKPAALTDLVLRGRTVFKLHEGRPTPFRDDGEVLYGKDPKAPMSMEEWVSGLQTDAPHLFEESKGAGSEPGTGRQQGNRIVLTRDQARDVKTWREAEANAAKSGAQLVVQD